MLHLRRLISIGLKGEWGPATVQWQAEVMQQSRRSEQIQGAVVFIGDSLIVGLATSNVALKSENFGINGDTLDWLLLRLPQYKLSAARAIVLEIGSNDWPVYDSADFAEFGAKYHRVLAMLPSHVLVIAVGLMPVNTHAAGVLEGDRLPSSFRQINKDIAAQCRQFSNCRFLDLFNALSDKSGNLETRYDAGDGNHLSTAGNVVWGTALASMLDRETGSFETPH
jgi:lysophospholipase L1-like esterase